MDYWEDRLAKNGKIDAYEKAILALRKSNKNAKAISKAYDALANCGLFGEEVDEMINLELENADG
jgi:hypothetical protein